MKKYIIPASVIVLIVIAVILTPILTDSADEVTQPQSSSMPMMSQAPQQREMMRETSRYRNGQYQATGNYVSPGGPRDVNVGITIEDGVIVASTFEGLATDPTSQRFQGEFADNYKPMVVGKNIDEVDLSKVAGSSLTPKGFNDAISKIKEQARS